MKRITALILLTCLLSGCQSGFSGSGHNEFYGEIKTGIETGRTRISN